MSMGEGATLCRTRTLRAAVTCSVPLSCAFRPIFERSVRRQAPWRLSDYDWDDAIREQAEPTRIHWAAFFGDVDHQIERVWGGLRVTLTYLIRRGGANIGRSAVPDRGRETLNSLVQQKLRALLDDRRFLARGGTLAFPCSHLPPSEARRIRACLPYTTSTVSAIDPCIGDGAAFLAFVELASYRSSWMKCWHRAVNAV